VTDAYDAMTHPRPYRSVRSPAEAADELLKDAGTLFDPEIVRAMLVALREDKILPN
jgi:HD-GYP domain-containing protein (c-di-GMP phosphodiesterase class II)